MTQATSNDREDLEQLRRRFEEFRGTQTSRVRLPETLWQEAGMAAGRYGVNVVAHELHLDYSKLKREMGKQDRPKVSRKRIPPPTFVELIGAAPEGMTSCLVEMESAQGGKLRLDLKAIATTELAGLIRAFLGH
jgi:hypothetical protein